MLQRWSLSYLCYGPRVRRKRYPKFPTTSIRSLVPDFNNDSELANGLEDVNLESTATRIAPYFVFASEASKNFFRSDLRPRYAALRTAVAEVATILAQINSGRAHSICEALQILQARTWFGCTIIHCPLERVSYWPGKVDSIKKSGMTLTAMRVGEWHSAILIILYLNSGDTDTTEQSDAGNGN